MQGIVFTLIIIRVGLSEGTNGPLSTESHVNVADILTEPQRQVYQCESGTCEPRTDSIDISTVRAEIEKMGQG